MHFILATDYLERRELTRGLGVEQAWTDYCTGLEAALLFNSYTYTVQPRPVLGKVDLASVFYSRTKYEAANIAFGTPNCAPRIDHVPQQTIAC
jgi:hypothetical protein